MNFAESVNYLYSLGHEVLAAKYGLTSIGLLLEKLGNPDRDLRAVLVAGTNGKGSVCAITESMARVAGIRTALYTSPHLIRIQERITVSGEEISETDFARLATATRVAAEALVAEGQLEAPPTFFEQVTAIALSYFAEQSPELAILEVGLGGRLDATNAVQPMISVVTSIDFDHQNLLGDTIDRIAAEKAAIIKRGARAVIGRQFYEGAAEVLMQRCLEVGVLPAFVNQPVITGSAELGRITFDYESSRSVYASLSLGLRGKHQADNAAAAIEISELLNEAGFAVSREAVIHGLREANWPGRLELIEDRPAILLDGAHNVAGARALRAFLTEFVDAPVTLMFGAMKDKDIDAMARELFPLARTIVLTHLKDQRAATGSLLARPALGTSSNVIFTETVRQAMSWARSVTPPDGLICVAGSLHVVGAVKRLFEEDESQGASV
jgi:dihydrofolate synthase/folylpolyglutamate synthase